MGHALMKIVSCEAMPSIRDFFPSIKNDLTKVTWAYGIYNNEDFRSTLAKKVTMIEGDVKMEVTRKLGKKFILLPKMYFKNSKFGISLNQFIKKVAVAKSAGVKLNFDKITAFEKSITVLQAMSGELKFPLWLNAVTDNMEEKYIDKFLSLCTHNFPEATISIGMLHKGQKFGSKELYTAKLVTQMKDTLIRNNVTQTVAFPVQMLGASYSLDTLPALKDVHGITDSALYIHLEEGQNYNYDIYTRVGKLIKNFGKDRVYLNVNEYVRGYIFKTLSSDSKPQQ